MLFSESIVSLIMLAFLIMQNVDNP